MIESSVKCYFMGKENYYHTGIFTTVSKSTLLMSVIDCVLRRRFNITTLCGPRTSLNTCELILQSKLNAGNTDFLAAKDVLERYLDVTPELMSKKFGMTSNPNKVKSRSYKSEMASPKISSSNQQKVSNAIPTIDLDCTDTDTPVVINLDDTTSEIANATDLLENNENISWRNNQKLYVLSEQRTSKRSHTSTESIEEKCARLLQEARIQESVRRKLSEDDSVILCSDDEVMVVEESSAPNDVVILDSEDDRCGTNTYTKDSKDAIKRTLLLLENMNSDKAVTACKRDIHNCLGPIEKRRKRKHKRKISKQVKKELKRQQKSVNVNCNLKPSSQIESVHDGKRKGKSTWQRPPHMDALFKTHTASHAVECGNHSTSNDPKSSCGVGSNIYNPNTSMKIHTGLRPVIIDGSNVAISHGKGEFSFRGLQICVDYFLKRGHKVIKVFVPQFRRHSSLRREPEIIGNLEKNDFLVFTPSRRVDGKMVVSYDDRYIVQTAVELGGVIVSTDNYRDLLSENPAWKETIEQRLLMFTWVDDILMFPQDPLGRYGPTLDEFLMFPNERNETAKEEEEEVQVQGDT